MEIIFYKAAKFDHSLNKLPHDIVLMQQCPEKNPDLIKYTAHS